MFPRPFTFICLGLSLELVPLLRLLSQHHGILGKAWWGRHKQMCLLAPCPGTAPFMQPQAAALAIGVQGSKGCQVSLAIQTGVSPVLSHPVSETLIHVARFQALVCTLWEDFFLLGGASAAILGYKCLCLLGGTFCEWPAHFCKKSSGNPQTHTRHSSTSDIGPFELF